jgi:hypothetical protein
LLIFGAKIKSRLLNPFFGAKKLDFKFRFLIFGAKKLRLQIPFSWRKNDRDFKFRFFNLWRENKIVTSKRHQRNVFGRGVEVRHLRELLGPI